MGRKENTTPQGDIAQILVEFLEVAITSVVFLKGVYPNGAFERKRYMNVVAHRAIHPQLNEYIHSAVAGLSPFLQKGLVDRVAVIFYGDERVPIERFVFNINANTSYDSKIQQSEIESSLRSFLIKLPLSEPATKVLPKNCKWEITAYIRSPSDVNPENSSEMWTPTHVKQWRHPPLIFPIKSMSSEPLNLQLYLEHPSLSEPETD